MELTTQAIKTALAAEFGTKVLGVTEDEYGNVRVKVQENSLYTHEFGVSRWWATQEIITHVARELRCTICRNSGPETGTGWNNED